MDFQPNRTLYCREEFCNVLSVFKRPDIVIATGNLAVTELGLDIQGRAVFLVMAELGPDPAQGAGSVGGCPLTFDPWAAAVLPGWDAGQDLMQQREASVGCVFRRDLSREALNISDKLLTQINMLTFSQLKTKIIFFLSQMPHF